ncbi:MAG: T9SS type A sorting domain-containing protein [Bacteroidetes bacterium]|nr:T9SS type A sorting domain-containing protein [Bacteroidota bacterium]
MKQTRFILCTALFLFFMQCMQGQSWQPCTPGYPPPSDNCSPVPQIMANNVYCGNTGNYTPNNANWFSTSGAFCSYSDEETIENNSFYLLKAAQTSINFTVCCGTGCLHAGDEFGVTGIQFDFFNFNTANGLGTCGTGGITSYYCLVQLSGTDCSPCTPKGCVVGTASGLTIGHYYYIMFDGYEGDKCPFQIQFPPNSILPIKLESFSGVPNASGNQLTWVTASEQNNSRFDIESSSDGESWKKIGTKNGMGTTEGAISYSFTDTNPYSFFTYYRLKQIDFNGNYFYSDIISVQNTLMNDAFLSPNPVADVLNIDINAKNNALYTFSFVSISGTVSLEKSMVLEKGTNRLKIEVTSIPSGIYFLQISDELGNNIGAKKVFKY